MGAIQGALRYSYCLSSRAYANGTGPISSVSLFGQTMVILNDAQMAFDLMEKRSGIYSSRPQLVFAGEM